MKYSKGLKYDQQRYSGQQYMQMAKKQNILYITP